MPSLKRQINKLLAGAAGEHEPDYALMAAVGVVVLFGLFMLASASSVCAYVKFHGDAYYYFKHQLFGLCLGLAAFWFFSKVDYHFWKKYALGFLVFSVVLLLLVFIPGLSSHYGKARSWINVFGFSLQPSEFVKISFLLYLAAWLEGRGRKFKEASESIVPFIAALGCIAGLMILQPDIGTLSIITITSLIVYFAGGGRIKHIIFIILAGILALTVLVSIKPYQMNRFKCMADPSFSPGDICYQVNQSLIAVGSGGITGRGLGESRQKYMYLPEVSGDSIFAIIAEETGFIFSSLLILAFLFIFYRGCAVSRRAPDGFGKILSLGIVSWLAAQALINIGGMINLLPLTGVPLPFISYGGTAILSAMIAAGILVNVSKQTR